MKQHMFFLMEAHRISFRRRQRGAAVKPFLFRGLPLDAFRSLWQISFIVTFKNM